MGGAAGERYGVLPYRKRVAGIEADAGVWPEPFGELDQLLAAQVLVVLDRDGQTGIAKPARLTSQRVARVAEQLVPPLPPARAATLEHRRQMKSQHHRAQRAAASNRILERFARLMRQPETADRLKSLQLLAQLAQLGIGERRQPPMIELDRGQPQLADESDESREDRLEPDSRAEYRGPAGRRCR